MQIRNSFIKVLGLGLVFVIISSFVKIEPDNSQINDTEYQSMAFKTDGLYYAEFFDYIYRGHFENIEITRENIDFLMIFEQYLRAYGRQCATFLPNDKVEIMNQVCATEQVSRNIYGDEIDRVCIEYKWVGSGLFARRDLYHAKIDVENLQKADGIQTAMSMITDPNAIGNSVDMMHKAKGLKNDMAQIFKLNSCSSSGLRRFEENLKSFALNKSSIRMQEISKYSVMKKSGGPFGSHDLSKLFDDLVANQARTWSMNRYTSGSVSGLTILSKDNDGRPVLAQANYVYSGFGNSAKGWVKITFENGLPKCLYFFDFPNNCKTPNSSIVASYAQGDYKKN